MKILIFNWRDIRHPLAGGAEISLFEHAKYWQKKGASVTWFASTFCGAKNTEMIDGIKIIRKGSHYTVQLLGFFYYISGKFSNVDVVIDSFHFIPFFTPLYVKEAKILALINEPAKKLWFKNIFFPLSLAGYMLEPLFFVFYKKKQFITGSNSIAEEISRDYKINNKNINVINHGVTLGPERFYPKEKLPTIIYASRISADKGIEDAIKAVAEIMQTIPQIQFWIIGRAEYKDYLQKIKNLIKAKKIDKITSLYGFVIEEKKFELFARAWILIHPSVREGWGLNVIEANSVGTPAIGYNVAGLKDSIQNGKTGILVKPNARDLARKTTELIQDSQELKKLAKTAVKWANNFTWSKSCEESWRLIQDAAKKNK